jgi:ligand-binding sensor domain-containing protein
MVKTKHLIVNLVLLGLLFQSCTAISPETNRPETSAGPTRTTPPFTTPFPSPVPGATPSPGSSPTPLPAVFTIPSTTTAAIPINPEWTRYVGINDVHGLAFAPDGSLWATTSAGLVGWDVRAETYTRYPIQARDIAASPDGSLWLAADHGLCHFTHDPAGGATCRNYTALDGLIHNSVRAVEVAPDGAVWAGTEVGLSRFDGTTWGNYPTSVPTEELAIARDGEVWHATAAGVGRYIPSQDAWMTYTEEHGLPNSRAMVIAVGSEGEVWTYVLWHGVYRLIGERWEAVGEVPGGLVGDIAFAADGTPWIATVGGTHYPGGSLVYREGNAWTDISSARGLTSIRTVALRSDGVVAASTNLGLGIYQGGTWRLLRDGPTSNQVTAVAITPDGAAWFAFGKYSVYTPGWGLSRFDGQAWEYFLDDEEVNALAVGPDGTLWAGVGCALQRFEGNAWETVAACDDLPIGNVLDIGFAADGAIWVANGFGLARFDGQSWTVYERMVHSLEVAPDGTIWMNGWEGTQGSFYVARFDGETWTTFPGADSFPGGFSLRAVTSDGLLWGMTPEGRFASFDGRSWAAEESWTLYDAPAALSLNDLSLLAAAPDDALWLAADGAMVRYDWGSAADEAWTIYTQEDGLPDSTYHAIAFGPGGEIWFGPTRLLGAKGGTNTERSTAAPRVVESAVPITPVTASGVPTPPCRPGEVFVDLSVPTTHLKVGQLLTVALTLGNGNESGVRLGAGRYSLSVGPRILVSGDLKPVKHQLSIGPGECDQAHFVLRAASPGRLTLAGSATYKMHALDYSWESWSGCQSRALEIAIAP